jgi:hypothetical protein
MENDPKKIILLKTVRAAALGGPKIQTFSLFFSLRAKTVVLEKPFFRL